MTTNTKLLCYSVQIGKEVNISSSNCLFVLIVTWNSFEQSWEILELDHYDVKSSWHNKTIDQCSVSSCLVDWSLACGKFSDLNVKAPTIWICQSVKAKVWFAKIYFHILTPYSMLSSADPSAGTSSSQSILLVGLSSWPWEGRSVTSFTAGLDFSRWPWERQIL